MFSLKGTIKRSSLSVSSLISTSKMAEMASYYLISFIRLSRWCIFDYCFWYLTIFSRLNRSITVKFNRILFPSLLPLSELTNTYDLNFYLKNISLNHVMDECAPIFRIINWYLNISLFSPKVPKNKFNIFLSGSNEL